MQVAQNSRMRSLNASMRRLFLFFSVIFFITGVQLFLLADHTAHYFAWTIAPSLTAAMLGAAFWASFVMVLGAALQRHWASARIAFPGTFVFVALTLIATLLHLEKLHLTRGDPLARAAAWTWLLTAIAVPPLMIVVLVWQLGAPGEAPRRVGPLPLWLRYIIGTHGVILLIVGAALFLLPGDTSLLWPWPLTPVSAQVIGAWLVGIGLTALLIVAQNDWPRVRAATNAYALLGALQIVALLRYHDSVDWSADSAWFFLIIAVSMFLIGLVCLSAARRY